MSNGRWSRIDEAPRDGTAILGSDVETGEQSVVKWFDLGGVYGGWATDINGKIVAFCPTHWMPLPEPPKVK